MIPMIVVVMITKDDMNAFQKEYAVSVVVSGRRFWCNSLDFRKISTKRINERRALIRGSSGNNILRTSACIQRMRGIKMSAKIVLTAKNSTLSSVNLRILVSRAVMLIAGRAKMTIRMSADVPSRKNRDSSDSEKSKRIGNKRAKKTRSRR